MTLVLIPYEANEAEIVGDLIGGTKGTICYPRKGKMFQTGTPNGEREPNTTKKGPKYCTMRAEFDTIKFSTHHCARRLFLFFFVVRSNKV